MRALLELFDARRRIFKISDGVRAVRGGVGRDRGPMSICLECRRHGIFIVLKYFLDSFQSPFMGDRTFRSFRAGSLNLSPLTRLNPPHGNERDLRMQNERP